MKFRTRTLRAVLALCSLVALSALVQLPSAAPVAAQPGTPAAAPAGVDCAQLASALQLAPDLVHYPRLETAAQQCGQPAAQAAAPPTCAQLTAALGVAPWLLTFTGPQQTHQACAGSQSAPQTAAQSFADLAGYGWATAAIDQLAALGVLQGEGGGRFAPGAPLTRAAFAALAQRTFHLQTPAAPVSFVDVHAGDWFYAAVEAAAPYMTSAPGPAFQPDAAISRIAAAAALGAILVARGTSADSAQQAQQVWARFADGGQVPQGLAADAATAVTAGLLVGEGASFGVNGQLSRAQAAVLFLRVLNASPGTNSGATSAGSGQAGTTAIAAAVWKGPAITPAAIPIGDGRVATAPEAGYVYSCTTSFRQGGAQHVGPWIDSAAGTWDATSKPAVQGAVSWPAASHSFSIQGNQRVITTDDLPEGATTGIFPIAPSDPAYQYDTNPNHILAQSLSYSLPVTPAAASAPSCLGLGPIGVMTNGVVLFDALDAAGRDAGAHEVQDSCDGHPQQAGIYHYHFVSACLMAQATGPSTLVGYALDGYGIYVERDAQGNLPTNADLDACHGRTSQVMWDGKPTVMYHYDATREYPYTLGCYHGTPTVQRGGR